MVTWIGGITKIVCEYTNSSYREISCDNLHYYKILLLESSIRIAYADHTHMHAYNK